MVSLSEVIWLFALWFVLKSPNLFFIKVSTNQLLPVIFYKLSLMAQQQVIHLKPLGHESDFSFLLSCHFSKYNWNTIVL